MRHILPTVLIVLLNCGPAQCADLNVDIWFVEELIQDLGKDDFGVRERATQRLIAIGPAVLTEIELASEGFRFDAETRERLQRIQREADIAHLSVDEAAAEYRRLNREIAELKSDAQNPKLVALRIRADRILRRIELIAPPVQRPRFLAELLAYTGKTLFYSRYNPALRYAIVDLQESVLYFDRHLTLNPQDNSIREARERTASLLGSALWLESPRFE